MKLIKLFHFSLLFLLLATGFSDKILIDYDNGNRGAGVNSQVSGANNLWIGDQNSINGDVNKVIGDGNKVEGSNNVIEGSNNVVGNVSPQEMERLQNQMLASMQNRFRGVFNFASFDQVVSPPKAVVAREPPAVEKKNENVVGQNTTTAVQQTQSVNHTLKEDQAKVINPPKNVTEKALPIVAQRQESKSKSTLIFRSYGSSISLQNSQIYYLQDQMSPGSSNYLCTRWSYCLHKETNQRWQFTSLFPSFPLLLDL